MIGGFVHDLTGDQFCVQRDQIIRRDNVVDMQSSGRGLPQECRVEIAVDIFVFFDRRGYHAILQAAQFEKQLKIRAGDIGVEVARADDRYSGVHLLQVCDIFCHDFSIIDPLIL